MHPEVVPNPPSSSPNTAALDPRGRLVLLCGRSFSGKSTVATWLQQSMSARVISLDAINAERGLAGGQGIPLKEWANTNDEAKRRAESALGEGATVVVDDTASLRFLRDGWRSVAEQSRAVFVLVFLDISLPALRERLLRNRQDAGRPDVVDAVMADHLASFEVPEADEAALTFHSEDITQQAVIASVHRALDRQRPG